MSTPNTHFGAAEIAHLLKNARKLFFIGIGGVNMSSLAELSLKAGYAVSGSDKTETALTDALSEKGITVYYSHDASHVRDCDAVIYTVAIAPDNPEYASAKANGIPCISRADYLGYIMMAYKCRIGISGMHGKSTTTSMCELAFSDAGADPTVLCGAVMPDAGSTYKIGNSEFFVFEACEYMDSFLDFNPTVAVILNIEMDHVDYFENLTQIRRSFGNFAAITGQAGLVIANADDDNVRLALNTYQGTIVTFSAKEKKYPEDDDPADFYVANTDMSRGLPSFDIVCRGDIISHVDLSVPGRHNIYNALATFATAVSLGLDPEAAVAGIARFTGAERRMELKGRFNGADVYDDYGHHPTEVAATLRGCREMGYEHVYCVFQSHTYSRTFKLFDDFVSALKLADMTIVADIYAAREKETFGVSGQSLAEAIGQSGEYYPDYEEMAQRLAGVAHERDAIVVMGAGDIYKLFPYLGLQKD